MDYEKVRAAFDGADTDGDGYVTIKEVIQYASEDQGGYQALMAALQRGDADHDRQLSQDEFVAYCESRR